MKPTIFTDIDQLIAALRIARRYVKTCADDVGAADADNGAIADLATIDAALVAVSRESR